ncbi:MULTISPECIES: hypothetical protein [unclassified Thioalkalivibrio]|uniref:hypothetical protein n=1 Tax=unclassified Thioalkalivibrio TaxID=2621013 RepID=UPI0012DD56C5|nr:MULTISPECIES: hypothetical protein [unclassified Thioalkalivibrio]
MKPDRAFPGETADHGPQKVRGPRAVWLWGLLLWPFLLMVPGVSATADPTPTLPLYELAGEVSLPFPAEPNRLADVFEHGSRLAVYQYTDERFSIGYTATVMLSPNPELMDGDPDEWLSDYLAGSLEAMDGRPLDQGALSIQGRPARYVTATMGVVGHVASSHTVAVFDQGRIHTWALQEFPSISGRVGQEIFAANRDRLRLSAAPAFQGRSGVFFPPPFSSLRLPSDEEQYESLGSVRFPFPGKPEIETLPLAVGQATAAQYVEPNSGRLYIGVRYEGLPSVHDPAETLLRGARQGQPARSEGVIDLADTEARYVFFPNQAPSQGGTYTLAFKLNGDVYQWSLMGRMQERHPELQAEFFEMAKQIRIR